MGEYVWKHIAFSIISQQQHVTKCRNVERGAAMLDWI